LITGARRSGGLRGEPPQSRIARAAQRPIACSSGPIRLVMALAQSTALRWLIGAEPRRFFRERPGISTFRE
jgi:hypothetical protein